jgi:hypothetical protein
MGGGRAFAALALLLLASAIAGSAAGSSTDCGKGFRFDGGWNSCGCCIPESCPPPMGYTYTRTTCRCPDESWTPCFDDEAKKYTVCVPPKESCPEKMMADPAYDKACLQQRTACLGKCADPKAMASCQKACPAPDSCKKAGTQTETPPTGPEKLPFTLGGAGANHPRARHPVIGVAQPPSTECPGGWVLLDTQWRMEQRKNCTLSYSELHEQKRKELSTVGYYIWAITNLPRELFDHDPCASYDHQCEYTAAHTWQCPSNNAIVSWDQTKTVSATSNGGCPTYG